MKQVMSQLPVLKTLQPEAHLSITLMEMADSGSPVGMVVVVEPCADGKMDVARAGEAGTVATARAGAYCRKSEAGIQS